MIWNTAKKIDAKQISSGLKPDKSLNTYIKFRNLV